VAEGARKGVVASFYKYIRENTQWLSSNKHKPYQPSQIPCGSYGVLGDKGNS